MILCEWGRHPNILAKRINPRIEILVAESKKGKKTFKGVIIVHKDSSISKISGLKGKRFAFGNKRSTIGRYLSQRYLLKHGIYAKDLKKYQYLGRHDRVGSLVGLKLLKKGIPIRKLVEFKNVTKPWVANAILSTSVKESLKKVLLNIKDKKVLKPLKKDGFLPASDDDYQTIRIAIEQNPKFFK